MPRAIVREHPGVFPVFVNRPPSTMDRLWLVEAFLETMEEAGFDAGTSLGAFRALHSYVIGYAMVEIQGFALEPEADRSHLESVDRDAEFEFGLDLILIGLEKKRGG